MAQRPPQDGHNRKHILVPAAIGAAVFVVLLVLVGSGGHKAPPATAPAATAPATSTPAATTTTPPAATTTAPPAATTTIPPWLRRGLDWSGQQVLVYRRVLPLGAPELPHELAIPVNEVSRLTNAPVAALIAAAQSANNGATQLMPLPAGTPALRSGGKPEVFWACSDGRGYCAVEAWPLVMALSKFGIFNGLRGEISSNASSYPSAPGPTFYGSTFISPWLSFVPVVTNGERFPGRSPALEAPTPAEASLRTEWDQPPFANSAGSPPFLDVGGRWVLGPPQVQYYIFLDLGGGFTNRYGLAAAQLGPAVVTVTTARASLAAAGFLVEDFCALTHDQPASTCSLVPKTAGQPGAKKGR